MRLLDLVTGEFAEFSSPSTIPPYAILSHRWDASEQTYHDIREIQRSCERNCQFAALAAPPPPFRFSLRNVNSIIPPPSSLRSIWDPDSGLSDKVRGACEAARKDGFQYLWIDSCCIDKTSSSELSESINSMFAWYRDAEVCYTFLADVPTSPSALLESKGSAFRSSVWFTRGWTLQELIAPRQLVFLSQTWELLGTKAILARLVEDITGIPVAVLTDVGRLSHRSLDKCSVAQRMSWAAYRTTTKVEDHAYSLLGIFDIQMSPLYGEGKRAFRRLQEEILRRIPDQTIFAWGNVYSQCPISIHTVNDPTTPNPDSIKARFQIGARPKNAPLATVLETVSQERCYPRFNFYASGSYMMFADSPGDFAGAERVVAVPLNVFRSLLAVYCEMSPQEYTSTPHGIRTSLPLLPLADCLIPNEDFCQDDYGSVDWYLAVLACEVSDFPGQLLCCICHLPALKPLVNTLHRGSLVDLGRHDSMAPDARYTLVRLSFNKQTRNTNLRPQTIYLDHPVRPPPLPLLHYLDAGGPGPLTFMLPTWCRGALDAQGYAAELQPEDPSGVHRLVLSACPLRTTAGLHRWTITADFGYEYEDDSTVRIIRATVRCVGGTCKASFTKSLEWRHAYYRPTDSYWQWHWALLSDGLWAMSEGHEDVRLELGVQLASASCYCIHVNTTIT